MSLFEDVMSLAVQMPMAERERLAQALGVKSAERRPSGPSLPMASLAARPDPVEWRKAETGHAVLDTGSATRDDVIGAPALRGMWSAQRGELEAQSTLSSQNMPRATGLPHGTPVIVHTDVCIALACGIENAVAFFTAPNVEIRLTTATYLMLLSAAGNREEQQRLARFVQEYSVVSLGPMASARSVELMHEYSLTNGLTPLDALIAATTLAYEIPLIARDPRPFHGIAGLLVCVPD